MHTPPASITTDQLVWCFIRWCRRHNVSRFVGPTDPTNLLTLCRRHHRMKHQTSWQVVMDAGGVCTWTDPFGQQFTTHPVNHHDTLAA